MELWWFLLFVDFILPAALIGFGLKFWKNPPEFDFPIAYTSRRAKRTPQSWRYAQIIYGKYSVIAGVIMIPVILAGMMTVRGKEMDTVGNTAAGMVVVTVALVIIAIVCTEKKLKQEFGE